MASLELFKRVCSLTKPWVNTNKIQYRVRVTSQSYPEGVGVLFAGARELR